MVMEGVCPIMYTHMHLKHKYTQKFTLLHSLYFLTLQSSLEIVIWLRVAPQTMTLLTQDCNRTGSGLRAGDSQNNTKKTAVCKYRICEHKENRTGHDFRRNFGKLLCVQCFLYELLILPLLNAKNVRADVIFIYCTLKKFLMAGMWLAHSVLR